jgi:hypothetical protein
LSNRYDISPQRCFRRIASIHDLRKHNENKQKINDQYAASGGIIDKFIDDAHKRAVISYFVGIFCGAVGIALYLKRHGLIGGALIGLGIFAPLTQWWLYVLTWGTSQ